MDAKIKAVTIIVSLALMLAAGCSDSQYSSPKNYRSSKRTSSHSDPLWGLEALAYVVPGEPVSNKKQEPKPLNYDPLVDAPPKVGLPHSFDAVTTKKAICKAITKFEKIDPGFVNHYANLIYRRVQNKLAEKGQSSLSEIDKTTRPGLPTTLTQKVNVVFKTVKIKGRFAIGVYWYADEKLEGVNKTIWFKAPSESGKRWSYDEWVYEKNN